MISEAEYIFFVAFGGLCVLVGLTLLKVQSTEPITITTNEFKTFQNNFLIGYMTVMLGEVLCVASFFHIMSSLNLSFDNITQLYIVSVSATTIFGIITEIFDIGSRRDKCVTTAFLYAIATFTLFSGGNMEILMLGRCLYGAGSVLLHSAFDSYLVHDHASQGFPDDWLLHTFSKLAHGMTIVAIASGIIGQSVASMFGPFGVAVLSIIFFLFIAMFILNTWNRDVGGNSKFMFSSFSQSVGQAMRSLRSNSQMSLVVALSVVSEASILIFTFYWAPLLSSVFAESIQASPSSAAATVTGIASTAVAAGTSSTSAPAAAALPFLPAVASLGSSTTSAAASLQSGVVQTAAAAAGGGAGEAVVSAARYLLEGAQNSLSPALPIDAQSAVVTGTSIPYMLIYASFMMSTMLGNYIYTLTISKYGNDFIFQVVLMVNASAFFLASVMGSPQLVFLCAIVIQTCSGGYWPSIGWLRGRYFLPEIRSVTITLTRVFTLCIIAPLLWTFHESFMMTMLVCSGLNAVAVFLQFKITQAELKLQGETDEYEYSGDDGGEDEHL